MATRVATIPFNTELNSDISDALDAAFSYSPETVSPIQDFATFKKSDKNGSSLAGRVQKQEQSKALSSPSRNRSLNDNATLPDSSTLQFDADAFLDDAYFEDPKQKPVSPKQVPPSQEQIAFLRNRYLLRHGATPEEARKFYSDDYLRQKQDNLNRLEEWQKNRSKAPSKDRKNADGCIIS